MMITLRGAAWGAVLVSGTLCSGACSAGSDIEGRASGGPSVRPISLQEYESRVASAVKPLQSALKELDKAKGYKGLEGRVTAVRQATGQTANALRAVTPPPATAREHTNLLLALQRTYADLNVVADLVDGRHLCTGGAVRARVGDTDGATALRTGITALEAKLPGGAVELAVPAAGQKRSKRPSNGKLIHSGRRGGRGSLIVRGGGDDAVVALAKGKKTFLSVYVRSGKKTTVRGIPDGKYTVYIAEGTDWDAKARTFGRECAFERFKDPIGYRTTVTATRISWKDWTIHLESDSGDPANTETVDPEDFPED
ncbi:hypothetical protein [Actinomadura sp. NBRC 104412]|uniref:hypothetical protein n=1 Tax=Actinomadura sp. NBRC 104412 TaxID=3032203 RepID=UPI0025550F08|nr:hypothetical protein [Actinomadura sp. NBRC 104412]